MPVRSRVFLVLAVPAAVLGYTAAAWLVGGLGLPDGIRELVVLFVPLFAGGLCAVPFLAPAFDHLARQALANRPTDDQPPDGPRRRDGER